MSGKQAWPEVLFRKYPHLFLPELERLENQADSEVEALCKIFSEFKVRNSCRILDLSCGIGRHSSRLAARGYEVVGYDPSSFFLKRAKYRERSQPSGKRAKYYHGSIRSVLKVLSAKKEVDFDVVISMFNSLGYTTQENDLQLFRHLTSLCAEDAILITETENRDWRIRNFVPYVISRSGKINLFESWEFDLTDSTAKSFSTYYQRKDDGNLRLLLELATRMRLYSLHELKNMLCRSGWKLLSSFGDLRLQNRVSIDSSDIVTISRKKRIEN